MRRRTKIVAVSVSALTVLGLGAGIAVATSAPASNASAKGKGVGEFGETKSFFNGKTVGFTYNKGFYCDTKIHSYASSGCEAGATYKKPPAKKFDPLYITVPLGFNVKAMSMECPNKLVCVDHPGTIDLTRLETALKPLYPGYTDAQLTDALKNYMTPGHEHFITTANGGKAEWWNVVVIGVEKRSSWDAINKHKSYSYIEKLQKNSNNGVTADIATNLFLYFSVQS